MRPEDIQRLADQASSLTANNRLAIAQLQANPRLNEMMLVSAANARSLRTAVLALERSPGFLAAADSARKAMASPAFQAAAKNWPRIAEQLIEERLDQIEPRLETLDDETATDPGTALDWATRELGATAPDGWGAVPLVWSVLPLARRRELRLRVLTLLAAIVWYAAALTSENDVGPDSLSSDAAPSMVAALLALGWLYASVASALEEAEATLADSVH